MIVCVFSKMEPERDHLEDHFGEITQGTLFHVPRFGNELTEGGVLQLFPFPAFGSRLVAFAQPAVFFWFAFG